MPSGRPDWHRIVVIEGYDGTQYIPVKTDDQGQLYALLKGHDGIQYIPIRVDSQGQIYALLKGYDGTQFVPLKTDSDGNIQAVLKADHAGTLVTVAADEQGFISVRQYWDQLQRVFVQQNMTPGIEYTLMNLTGRGIVDQLFIRSWWQGTNPNIHEVTFSIQVDGNEVFTSDITELVYQGAIGDHGYVLSITSCYKDVDAGRVTIGMVAPKPIGFKTSFVLKATLSLFMTSGFTEVRSTYYTT